MNTRAALVPFASGAKPRSLSGGRAGGWSSQGRQARAGVCPTKVAEAQKSAVTVTTDTMSTSSAATPAAWLPAPTRRWPAGDRTDERPSSSSPALIEDLVYELTAVPAPTPQGHSSTRDRGAGGVSHCRLRSRCRAPQPQWSDGGNYQAGPTPLSPRRTPTGDAPARAGRRRRRGRREQEGTAAAPRCPEQAGGRPRSGERRRRRRSLRLFDDGDRGERPSERSHRRQSDLAVTFMVPSL